MVAAIEQDCPVNRNAHQSLTRCIAQLAGALWLASLRLAAASARERCQRGLPQGSKLAYVETTFSTRTLPSIIARPDRVYRLPSGELFLVELKTRRSCTVTTEDIIQMSAQRLAVSEATGQVVRREAYIVFRRSEARLGRQEVRALRLMSSEAVRALAIRRLHLLRGLARPEGPGSTQACRCCGFTNPCRAAGVSARRQT